MSAGYDKHSIGLSNSRLPVERAWGEEYRKGISSHGSDQRPWEGREPFAAVYHLKQPGSVRRLCRHAAHLLVRSLSEWIKTWRQGRACGLPRQIVRGLETLGREKGFLSCRGQDVSAKCARTRNVTLACQSRRHPSVPSRYLPLPAVKFASSVKHATNATRDSFHPPPPRDKPTFTLLTRN